MLRKDPIADVDLLETFSSGRSPVWLSKVTVSSPVSQSLSWNQPWLCRALQTSLKHLVFWMILVEASPGWSSSLPSIQSLSSSESSSLRPQASAKVDLAESGSLSSYPEQGSDRTIHLTSLDLVANRRYQPAQGAKPSLFVSTPSQTLPSACWRLPFTQAACSFSSNKLKLAPDGQVISQVPPDPLGTPPRGTPLNLPLRLPPSPNLPQPVLRGTPPNLPPTAKLEDPELGVIITKPTGEFDPELGLPRLQERILEPRPSAAVARQPSVYLIGRVDYFRTTNVFSGDNPIKDGLIRSGLTLFYAPAIGRNTYLVTSIDGSLIRYNNLGFLNYNELRLRAGVLQRLSPRTFGEIGWSNQQLFATKEGLKDAFRGNRFLNDNAIRLELSRQDALSPKLALNTFYQLRLSFADPNDRSRLINSFISSLSYSWSPNFQTALDYQVAWSHFTQQSRDDVYHQLVARLTYTLTSQSQLNVFSGFSFGDSSDARINFNSFIVGVGVVINLPLF